MAERGELKGIQVWMSEEEKSRLESISKFTERDQSKMVRFLINREYATLFPTSEGTVSTETPITKGLSTDAMFAALKAAGLGE